MKSIFWIILFSLLAQIAISQQKGGGGSVSNNDFEMILSSSKNAKSTQNKGLVDYKLELFPGQVFTGWYYFWSNGGIKNCNLKENPEAGWLSITPNKFTSTGCTNIVPVKFSFVAPVGEGVYISYLVDSTANWDSMRVEIKVTKSPVNHIKKRFGINQDSISYKSYLRDTPLNWTYNTCIKDYWPADSIQYDFKISPPVNWLGIYPLSGKASRNEKKDLQNTIYKKVFDSTWVTLERKYYSFPTFYHYYVKETASKEYLLRFNGENGITTGYLPGNTTKTLMYWVRFDEISNMAIGVHDSENHRFYLGIQSNNTLFAGMGDGYSASTSLNFIPGKWYHMALTTSQDLDSAIVYINATEVARWKYSFSGESKAGLYIGARNDFTTFGYFIKGLIDEVQVWERPLSRNEIVQYMFEALKGNESGLAIYYPFNEGWGDFTKNSVDNYYYGTLFKEPVWIDSIKHPDEYPAISSQPSDQNVTYGDAASFTVSATGTATLTYQWQQDAGSGFTGINNNGIYSGVTTADLNISLPTYSMNGYKYQVIVNPGGSQSITSNSATLKVNKRTITINAESKTKVYGLNDPALTSKVTAGTIVGTDAATGTLARAAGEKVGTYNISKNSYTFGSNYDETFLGANLTITPLPVTVNAQPKIKVPGTVDPPLTFLSSPPVGTELPNHDLISFTGALSRAPGEAVGVYPIGQNTLANSNYFITYIGANLTITPSTRIEPVLQGKPGLKVYPNPFNNDLYFELRWDKGVKASIEIFNINGVKLATVFSGDIEAFHDYRLEYSPQNISTGLLIYRMTIDGQLALTGKLMHK